MSGMWGVKEVFCWCLLCAPGWLGAFCMYSHSSLCRISIVITVLCLRKPDEEISTCCKCKWRYQIVELAFLVPIFFLIQHSALEIPGSFLCPIEPMIFWLNLKGQILSVDCGPKCTTGKSIDLKYNVCY